jgi:hypothetical protein
MHCIAYFVALHIFGLFLGARCGLMHAIHADIHTGGPLSGGLLMLGLAGTVCLPGYRIMRGRMLVGTVCWRRSKLWRVPRRMLAQVIICRHNAS